MNEEKITNNQYLNLNLILDKRHYDMMQQIYENQRPIRQVRYQTTKKKVNIDLKKTATAIIVTCGILFGAAQIKSEMKKIEYIDDLVPNFGSTIDGRINQDGNHVFWYKYDAQAESILKSNESIDHLIYGYYNLYEYDKSKHMDALFEALSRLININPDKYENEIITKLNHPNFASYLKNQNFNSIQEWEELMDEIFAKGGR